MFNTTSQLHWNWGCIARLSYHCVILSSVLLFWSACVTYHIVLWAPSIVFGLSFCSVWIYSVWFMISGFCSCMFDCSAVNKLSSVILTRSWIIPADSVYIVFDPLPGLLTMKCYFFDSPVCLHSTTACVTCEYRNKPPWFEICWVWDWFLHCKAWQTASWSLLLKNNMG